MSCSQLEEELESLQWWNVYTHTVQMLERRGYQGCQRLYRTLSEFRALYEATLNDELVLNSLSMVVSKTRVDSDFLELPRINDVVATALKLSGCTQEYDENLQRDILCVEVGQSDASQIRIQRCEPHEVIVLFCRKRSGAIGIESVNQLLKYQQMLRNMHLILILQNERNPNSVITPQPRKLLSLRRYPEHTVTGAIVEWFSWLDMSRDLTATIFHAKYEKYSAERASVWLKEHQLQPHQVETINVSDKMSSYYDLRTGDLVAIDSHDGTQSFVVIGTQK